jgi:hypothetical protein
VRFGYGKLPMLLVRVHRDFAHEYGLQITTNLLQHTSLLKALETAHNWSTTLQMSLLGQRESKMVFLGST